MTLLAPEKPTAPTKVYEENHRKIEDTYLRLLEVNGYPPTIDKLAEEVGLASSTIQRHLSDLRIETFKPKQKIILDKVLTILGNKALQGDLKAISMYLSVIGDFVPKTEVEQVGRDSVLKIEFVKSKIEITDKKVEINSAENE